MIAIMWQFDVKNGRETEFEQLYGADGAWTTMNRHTRSYLGRAPGDLHGTQCARSYRADLVTARYVLNSSAARPAGSAPSGLTPATPFFTTFQGLLTT